MFRIHIARNRQSLGEFTPEEVAEGLHNGKFLPTDLAWREPMPAWKPLSEFDNLPVYKVVPPPVIEGEIPVNAPVVDAVVSSEVEPAWERRASLGILPALFATVQQILSTPTFTFRSMPKTGGLQGPLFFYLIIATITTWVSIVYQAAYFHFDPAALAQLPKTATPELIMGSQIAMAVLAPGFAAIGAFLLSGVFHFVLKALGADSTYESTFRVFCYVTGAAAVLQLVPICGMYLTLAVQIVYLTIAFREVHRVSTWQASFGATLPIILCCGLGIGAYVAALAVTMSAK